MDQPSRRSADYQRTGSGYRQARVMQPRQLSMSIDNRTPAMTSWKRRNHSYLGTTALIQRVEDDIVTEVPLVSFKFKDVNDDYRKIKIPLTVGYGAFEQFVMDVRRRFAGSAKVGQIKIKYVDDEGDEVLLTGEDDLISCLEDCKNWERKTILLKVTAMKGTLSSNTPSSSSLASSTLQENPDPLSSSQVAHQDDRSPVSSSDLPVTSGKKSTGTNTESKSTVKSGAMRKVNRARKLMHENKLDESIKLYEEVLQADSQNPWALCGRAAAHLLNGDSGIAESDYRAAMALMDNEKERIADEVTLEMCMGGLVEAFITQKRYEEAATLARRIDPAASQSDFVAHFRDEVDAQSKAALPAVEKQDFQSALVCYSNAIRAEAACLQLSSADDPRASLRLGRAVCYKGLDDYERALRDYGAAVKLKPDNLTGLKGCGICLFELGQFDKALEAFERARKLDPTDKDAIKGVEAVMNLQASSSKSKREEMAKLGALLKSSVLRKPSTFARFRKD